MKHHQNIEELGPFPEDGDDPFLVNVIVETPRGTRHKYAFDKKSGLFRRRATIPEGLAWPYDFGFVPGTLGDDGDPLDILYLDDEPAFPGCLTEARLLGIIRLQKNGEQNDRLVSAPKRIEGVAQSSDPFEDIGDVPEATIASLRRFLVEYSEETGNEVKCTGVDGRDAALAAIRAGIGV